MDKIQAFADLLETEQKERLRLDELDCQTNINNCKVTIKKGNKYTKVNVGDSGKYMVDKEGNIFGIKGYGVIHKGQHFGTLNTINSYSWGDYRASLK